ncbi:MAG TPA: hypothetical protein VJ859_09495 [Allosphingosinicella sp.]|nr:hypothetical protein [Allosphingosinicella sp.]
MIDEILIDRFFSPLAGGLHHRFGLSQWRLSLECLNGNIVFYLAGIALSIAGKGMQDGIFADMLRAMVWLWIMDFARRVAHRQAASSIGVQSARMGEWMVRLILVAMMPLSLLYVRGMAGLCFFTSLILLIAHLYFKASDTPPPQWRRKSALARSRA